MKVLLLLAKVAILFVWFVLFANFFVDFPAKAAIALYIMLGFLLFMHGLQMMIFIGAFGDKIKISRWEKWSILIFGIFSLLDIRRKHMIKK